MPIYDFQDEWGRTHEEHFSVDDRPKVGETVKLSSGVRAKRVFSLPPVSVQSDVNFVCNSADRKWHGSGPDPAPRRDSKGRPLIASRKEAIEFGKATGAIYNEL